MDQCIHFYRFDDDLEIRQALLTRLFNPVMTSDTPEFSEWLGIVNITITE